MADHRRKRETTARFNPFRLRTGRARASVIAAPLAVLATGSVVSLGVFGAQVAAPAEVAAPASSSPASVATDSAAHSESQDFARHQQLSRSFARTAARSSADEPTKLKKPSKPSKPSKVEKMLEPSAIRAAIAGATDEQYTTDALNLWTEPGEKAEQDGEIAAGEKVVPTGRALFGRVEIVAGKHETHWVTAGYLATEKPLATSGGISDSPCPDGGVENGLTSNAVLVYRSVCNTFPQVARYGGYDNHGEHASGRALDIMTSDPALLTAIGDYLRTNAAGLHLYDVIRLQHIWTPQRGGEGWRLMPSRGSTTADHYDHVHVSTY